jgi:hypothetical protein
MSLIRALDLLNQNNKVSIRNLNGEVIICLDEDIIKIYPFERIAEFLDIDSTDKKTLKDKYYTKFPDLRQFVKKLVKEGYDIQP